MRMEDIAGHVIKHDDEQMRRVQQMRIDVEMEQMTEQQHLIMQQQQKNVTIVIQQIEIDVIMHVRWKIHMLVIMIYHEK